MREIAYKARDCRQCGASFIPDHSGRLMCSAECRQKRQAEHHARWKRKPGNKEKVAAGARRRKTENPRYYRDLQYRHRYGLDSDAVDSMLAAQDHKCAICERPMSVAGNKGRDLPVVDHCHTTGQIRGLLCTPCNLSIGYAGDRPNVLRAAIEYLERA